MAKKIEYCTECGRKTSLGICASCVNSKKEDQKPKGGKGMRTRVSVLLFLVLAGAVVFLSGFFSSNSVSARPTGIIQWVSGILCATTAPEICEATGAAWSWTVPEKGTVHITVGVESTNTGPDENERLTWESSWGESGELVTTGLSSVSFTLEVEAGETLSVNFSHPMTSPGGSVLAFVRGQFTATPPTATPEPSPTATSVPPTATPEPSPTATSVPPTATPPACQNGTGWLDIVAFYDADDNGLLGENEEQIFGDLWEVWIYNNDVVILRFALRHDQLPETTSLLPGTRITSAKLFHPAVGELETALRVWVPDKGSEDGLDPWEIYPNQHGIWHSLPELNRQKELVSQGCDDHLLSVGIR